MGDGASRQYRPDNDKSFTSIMKKLRKDGEEVIARPGSTSTQERQAELSYLQQRCVIKPLKHGYEMYDAIDPKSAAPPATLVVSGINGISEKGVGLGSANTSRGPSPQGSLANTRGPSPQRTRTLSPQPRLTVPEAGRTYSPPRAGTPSRAQTQESLGAVESLARVLGSDYITRRNGAAGGLGEEAGSSVAETLSKVLTQRSVNTMQANNNLRKMNGPQLFPEVGKIGLQSGEIEPAQDRQHEAQLGSNRRPLGGSLRCRRLPTTTASPTLTSPTLSSAAKVADPPRKLGSLRVPESLSQRARSPRPRNLGSLRVPPSCAATPSAPATPPVRSRLMKEPCVPVAIGPGGSSLTVPMQPGGCSLTVPMQPEGVPVAIGPGGSSLTVPMQPGCSLTLPMPDTAAAVCQGTVGTARANSIPSSRANSITPSCTPQQRYRCLEADRTYAAAMSQVRRHLSSRRPSRSPERSRVITRLQSRSPERSESYAPSYRPTACRSPERSDVIGLSDVGAGLSYAPSYQPTACRSPERQRSDVIGLSDVGAGLSYAPSYRPTVRGSSLVTTAAPVAAPGSALVVAPGLSVATSAAPGAASVAPPGLSVATSAAPGAASVAAPLSIATSAAPGTAPVVASAATPGLSVATSAAPAAVPVVASVAAPGVSIATSAAPGAASVVAPGLSVATSAAPAVTPGLSVATSAAPGVAPGLSVATSAAPGGTPGFSLTLPMTTRSISPPRVSHAIPSSLSVRSSRAEPLIASVRSCHVEPPLMPTNVSVGLSTATTVQRRTSCPTATVVQTPRSTYEQRRSITPASSSKGGSFAVPMVTQSLRVPLGRSPQMRTRSPQVAGPPRRYPMARELSVHERPLSMHPTRQQSVHERAPVGNRSPLTPGPASYLPPASARAQSPVDFWAQSPYDQSVGPVSQLLDSTYGNPDIQPESIGAVPVVETFVPVYPDIQTESIQGTMPVVETFVPVDRYWATNSTLPEIDTDLRDVIGENDKLSYTAEVYLVS